jgi:hypothetical protein
VRRRSVGDALGAKMWITSSSLAKADLENLGDTKHSCILAFFSISILYPKITSKSKDM